MVMFGFSSNCRAELMSRRVNVRALHIPNCQCGPAIRDGKGRVVRLKTCPACQRIRLDIIRGIEYAGAYVKCGDAVKHVLLKQKEFFST